MEITQQKKVTKLEKVIIGHKCDICKKQHDGDDYPDSWHYFHHQHEAWGNDSCDSAEWFLVCSPECYFKQLVKSLKKVGGNYGAEIDEKTKDFVIHLLEYIKGITPKT